MRYQTKILIIDIILCYSVIVIASWRLLYFLGYQNCVVSNYPVYIMRYNVFADILSVVLWCFFCVWKFSFQSLKYGHISWLVCTCLRRLVVIEQKINSAQNICILLSLLRGYFFKLYFLHKYLLVVSCAIHPWVASAEVFGNFLRFRILIQSSKQNALEIFKTKIKSFTLLFKGMQLCSWESNVNRHDAAKKKLTEKFRHTIENCAIILLAYPFK